MEKRVTVKDIAEAAGVTTATVSYVLNDNPKQTISPETRRRVLKAAEELQYVPNMAAKLLKNRQNYCIGVVIKKNLAIPRFNQTLQGIVNTLDACGYNILLCGNQKKNGVFIDYLNVFFERRIDGVIFLGKDNQGPDEESKKTIIDNKVPFVAFDCQTTGDGYSTVDFDYARSARQVAMMVLEKSSNHFVYVRPKINNAQEMLREAGVRKAMEAYPDRSLEVLTVNISQDDLDAVDKEKYMGRTKAAENISRLIMDSIGKLPSMLDNGDGVVSSWETWTGLIRNQCEGKQVIIGEMANNGETQIYADYYALLPNYEAGQCCAELILKQLEGKTAEEVKLLPQCKRKQEAHFWTT